MGTCQILIEHAKNGIDPGTVGRVPHPENRPTQNEYLGRPMHCRMLEIGTLFSRTGVAPRASLAPDNQRPILLVDPII